MSEDFSKVQRYGMITKSFYEEEYEAIGEDKFGEYVSYKDYLSLLNAKTVPRLPADFSDVVKEMEIYCKKLEKQADFFIDKKDKFNYQYACGNYNKSWEIRQLLNELKKTVFVKGK